MAMANNLLEQSPDESSGTEESEDEMLGMIRQEKPQPYLFEPPGRNRVEEAPAPNPPGDDRLGNTRW